MKYRRHLGKTKTKLIRISKAHLDVLEAEGYSVQSFLDYHLEKYKDHDSMFGDHITKEYEKWMEELAKEDL
jgi:hypothetical protein